MRWLSPNPMVVVRRSWVLFYDADLAAEWVGVYPETPPRRASRTTNS
jgi:hypothetical protein